MLPVFLILLPTPIIKISCKDGNFPQRAGDIEQEEGTFQILGGRENQPETGAPTFGSIPKGPIVAAECFSGSTSGR